MTVDIDEVWRQYLETKKIDWGTVKQLSKDECFELIDRLRMTAKVETLAKATMPSDKALAEVEWKHPNVSRAEKWRLAQAQTLLDNLSSDKP